MLKAAALALALPALLAGCLGGESPTAQATGQIDGAVVDGLLFPYANQTVHLVQADRTDQTSPLGGFTFRDVAIGFYTLTTTLADGTSATQVVDVEADKVTRVILQLRPEPPQAPYFEVFPHKSTQAERSEAGSECVPCRHIIPLAADRPAEVTLEAVWSAGPVLGARDQLDLVVSDDRGFALYKGRAPTSPHSVSILGSDLHPDAKELRVQVWYGPEFTPQLAFRMTSFVTLYHGATQAEMFGAAANP